MVDWYRFTIIVDISNLGHLILQCTENIAIVVDRLCLPAASHTRAKSRSVND